jgi:hypothetical protein
MMVLPIPIRFPEELMPLSRHLTGLFAELKGHPQFQFSSGPILASETNILRRGNPVFSEIRAEISNTCQYVAKR